MIVTLELATYLDRVTRAIDSGKGEIPLTDRCPECGDKVDTWISAADPNDAHLTYQVTSDVYAVLVGCEGYWTVNPALVGMDGHLWHDADGNVPNAPEQPVCVLNMDPNA